MSLIAIPIAIIVYLALGATLGRRLRASSLPSRPALSERGPAHDRPFSRPSRAPRAAFPQPIPLERIP